MTKITRVTTVSHLAEFLNATSRATVAWSHDGQIVAEPVAFRFKGGKYLIGTPPEHLAADAVVAVLIDDGSMYFDLRGVRIRGPTTAMEEGHGGGLSWFEVKPEREVAWHYGILRER